MVPREYNSINIELQRRGYVIAMTIIINLVNFLIMVTFDRCVKIQAIAREDKGVWGVDYNKSPVVTFYPSQELWGRRKRR